ncbi:MAG TPA: glycosyltransferase family 2 protein [Chitinophagaceae bacterium]
MSLKVSIITVTYNSAKYVDDCINSIIRQNYKNIEYIVIDGKSTDGTVDIIKKYSSYISTWISEEDGGMYDALNKGMAIATGDVVGILNSDDVLASADVISEIVNCFQQNNVDSIYGDLVYVDPFDLQKVLRFWKGLPYERRRFKYGWMPAHPTFYIRRELIEKFGGYESHYFTAADFEFMARYLYRFKISSFYLEKLVVKMRAGGASNESFLRRLRANRRDYLAMKKNEIPFPLIVSILKPLIKMPQFYNALFYKISKPTTPYKTFKLSSFPND